MAGSTGTPVAASAAFADIDPAAVRSARNADLLVFAANGLLLATWMSRLPDVKTGMALTPGRLGLLLLAISLGSLTGLPLAGRIIERIGTVRVIRGFGLLAAGGLSIAAALATAGQPFAAVALCLLCFGFGGGIWDVAQNLEGTMIEQGLGRAIMPWFHAAFSGGTLLGALLAIPLIKAGLPVSVHVAIIAALVAATLLLGSRRFISDRIPAPAPTDDDIAAAKPRSAWTEPRTLIIGVMVLAAAFTEGTANDWLAVAFVDGHELAPAMGVFGLAAFLSCMTLGRILGATLLDRYGRVPVLRVLFGCAAVGSLLVVFGSTALAFVGAAIWGLGSSLGFPVGMSAAADDPERAAVRLSVVATIGYGAFLAGPALVGFLGDHVGTLKALSVVGLFSVIALLAVPAAKPLPQE